jgi:hypothetical protein
MQGACSKDNCVTEIASSANQSGTDILISPDGHW